MKTIAKKPSCQPRGNWCRDARSAASRVPPLLLHRRERAPKKTLLAWALGLTAIATLTIAIARPAWLGF